MHLIRKRYFLSGQLNAQLSCNYEMLLLGREEIIGFYFFSENPLKATNLFSLENAIIYFLRKELYF